ncbi:NUDIX hydrolase [Kitasatospora sp. NPDC059648]|uniref:NUDIX hydrolase n=1 Tax=Kitasatospora sp. NPDC059648 TaxID=3346894 RepID=UPI003694432F
MHDRLSTGQSRPTEGQSRPTEGQSRPTEGQSRPDPARRVGALAAGTGRAPVVLAAGAVLWLPGKPKPSGRLGRPRIAVIHRPKYDDWSLPKGKLDPGEGVVEAALREVAEETGFRCLLGPELPAQHYLAQGRPKEVRYWAAVPTGGAFRPNREVDRLEWLPAGKARARLTHDRDRLLVDALLAILGAKPVRTSVEPRAKELWK